MNVTIIVMLPERGATDWSGDGHNHYRHLSFVEVRPYEPCDIVHSARTGLLHVVDIDRVPGGLKGKGKFEKMKSLEEQWKDRLMVGAEPVQHMAAKRAWALDPGLLSPEETAEFLYRRQLWLAADRFFANLTHRGEKA